MSFRPAAGKPLGQRDWHFPLFGGSFKVVAPQIRALLESLCSRNKGFHS